MARTGGARASAPLISTKFAIPRRRSDTLRRARLVDAIHHMIDRQLYLVVAPAGYGKTTLLVDFASDSDIPVCWYSLSPSDAEPAVFLDYMVAAIQARFPRFGIDTRRVMAQTNFRTDAMAVVATLVNEIQERIPDYFTVVLDDYHEVNDSAPVNQLVDTLLKHAPENFRLIISSRTMPRLQLSRLAALRQAAGTGAKDLRFTTDEVRDLMRDAFQTVLPDRVVEELTTRSEGWITGIILTTHTMWQGLFESMIRKSGQEQLYGYLANEVFARQTPSVQRFLLASSILEDLEPSVAGSLAGISRADHLLRQLDEGNLFVTELEGRKRVYRYHHLFRDFLRSRLDQGILGLSRSELERRAGALYQQRAQHEQAIGHLLAAGAFEEAATSVLAIAEDTFTRGRLETLAGWIDRLPDHLQRARPHLALWRAQVAIQRGEHNAAIEACRAIEDQASRKGEEALAAEAAVHRAAAVRLLGDSQQARELCEQALAVLGEERTPRRALALRILGLACWRLGELRPAMSYLEQSHALYEALGDDAAAAYLRNDLGNVGTFLGLIGEARQQFERSAAYWRAVGNAGRLGLTLSNLGVMAYLEEDFPEAIRLFESAIGHAQEGLFTVAEALASWSLGDVYRDLEEFDKAQAAYERAYSLAFSGTDRAEVPAFLNAMALSYRLQGLYPKAEGALRRARASASGFQIAQLKLTSGICSADRRSHRRARTLLSEALDVFRTAGARYEAAQALFHLARVHYRQGAVAQSDALLEECCGILHELGVSQFLTVEAPRSADFIDQAAARGIGDGLLSSLFDRLSRSRPPVHLTAPTPMPARRRLAVRALGHLEVRLDGRTVGPREWGTQTARELFLYLLLNRDGEPKEKLMAVLAPEATQARANSLFHVAAYRVRRALYKGCLRFDGLCYQLDPALAVEFDVTSFHEAVTAADRAARGSADELAALRRAVDIYQGRFLDSSYSEWALAEQRRLEDQFLHAASRLASSYLQASEYESAIAAAERGLAADNSLEELHEVILRAHLGLHRREAAVRHLEAYSAYLQAELGADTPSRLVSLLDREGHARPHLLVHR